MFSITKNIAKKAPGGFTLLEILVALVISSIIILGVFNIFKTILNARNYSLKKAREMEIVSKTISLIDADIRCKIGAFRVDTTFGVTRLIFTTTHSLLFAGSLPVVVSYFIKEENGHYTLYRREENIRAGEDMSIALSHAFKKVSYQFYLDGQWTNNTPTNIIKITLTDIDNRKYTFAIRGMVEE